MLEMAHAASLVRMVSSSPTAEVCLALDAFAPQLPPADPALMQLPLRLIQRPGHGWRRRRDGEAIRHQEELEKGGNERYMRDPGPAPANLQHLEPGSHALPVAAASLADP